ncbi:MAG: DUF5655 domain-containing protein [Planctomycetes bacterium]|nr:DUF5655 domain-containing protein [Planctomycetota bacterium]
MSHSCGDYSVAKFLEGKSAAARKLFRAFERAIAECGPYDVAPAKTRVAFLAQVRFASVNRVAGDALDVHFVLPRRLEGTRFRKIEKLARLYVHHLRVTKIDGELKRWIRASYHEYGQREWLKR